MPRINISSREIEKILRKNGFKLVFQKGSHQQFKGTVGDEKKRVTVLANKHDFDPKTFKSMVRQSGLAETKFMKHSKKFK